VEATVVSLAEIFTLQHCRSSSDLIPQQQSKAMAAEDTTRKQHFHNTLEWVAGRLSELSSAELHCTALHCRVLHTLATNVLLQLLISNNLLQNEQR
jgi:hypothetical protein